MTPGSSALLPRGLRSPVARTPSPAVMPSLAALLLRALQSPVAPGALRGTRPSCRHVSSESAPQPQPEGQELGIWRPAGGMAGRPEGLTRAEGPCPSGADPGGPTAYRCPHPTVPGPTWHPCGPWPLRACQQIHVPSSEGPRRLSGCSWELRSHTHPGAAEAGVKHPPGPPGRMRGSGGPQGRTWGLGGPQGDTRQGGAGLPLPTS